MSNQTVKIHKVVFSAPSRGFEQIEHVVATDQQVNDYMIGQASSLGCIYNALPVDNDGGLVWDTSNIPELKIL